LYYSDKMQGTDFQYIRDLERYTAEFEIHTDNFDPEYPSTLESLKLQDQQIWLKRDDELELGCSKQRSIVYMIGKYLEMGKTKFVVSSSGNAALVSAYIGLHSYSDVEEVKILLSEQISDSKLTKMLKSLHLEDELTVEDLREGPQLEKVKFEFSVNPKQQAFQLEKEGWTNLRGSTDDLAIIGFKTIANEIIHELGQNKPDAVFIAASSGTTALGIYQGFSELSIYPQIHVVQTTKTYALLKKLKNIDLPIEPEHPAESIIDVIGHRRKTIETIISESKGDGWVIDVEECIEARRELRNEYNVTTGYDSALTWAAYKKAVESQKFQNPVLVFTG
jgi:threonine synthase